MFITGGETRRVKGALVPAARHGMTRFTTLLRSASSALRATN
jgi:hypothetical protein